MKKIYNEKTCVFFLLFFCPTLLELYNVKTFQKDTWKDNNVHRTLKWIMNTIMSFTVTPRGLEREETLKNFIFIHYFITFDTPSRSKI